MLFKNPHLDRTYDISDQLRASIHTAALNAIHAQDKTKAAISNIAEFETHREKVKTKFLKSIGGLPEEKTPLNARVTGTIECANYTVEKLIFESQPGYPVTAACYLPLDLTEKAPAVLFLCGHATDGKAHDTYQAVCQDLAANGFVVLTIDPYGQGERFQYWQDSEPAYGMGIIEHTHGGLPEFLMGASVTRHFIWDAVRGIDYLESRPEVDRTRIGVTGNSGGGTQTCCLMLVESRISAAVACTFPSSLEMILKSGQAQDMEQILPRCMADGPDHDDFITAIAPKPVLVGAVSYDFFPIEGTLESVRCAKRIYKLYGCSENLDIAIDESKHCYSDGLRQACVNWFRAHLQNRPKDFVTGARVVLPVDQLWVTPSGQVLRDFPIYRTVSDLSEDLLDTISIPDEDLTPASRRAALARVLALGATGDRDAPIWPRIEDTTFKDHHTQAIWFFSAPDVIVAGILIWPHGISKPDVTVLVEPTGSTNLEDNPRVQPLLDQGQAVFVLNVRGTGPLQTRSVCYLDGTEISPPFNTEYRLACDATMAGFNLLGQRVFDILRTFDYLSTREDLGSVSLHGFGPAATWAYFAAVLEPRIAGITAEEMLYSYRDLCRTPLYDHILWDLRIMAHGLLLAGDIEDYLPCLTGRPVHFITPLDATGQPVLWEPRLSLSTIALSHQP